MMKRFLLKIVHLGRDRRTLRTLRFYEDKGLTSSQHGWALPGFYKAGDRRTPSKLILASERDVGFFADPRSSE